jgi:hypothetical protein
MHMHETAAVGETEGHTSGIGWHPLTITRVCGHSVDSRSRPADVTGSCTSPVNHSSARRWRQHGGCAVTTADAVVTAVVAV